MQFSKIRISLETSNKLKSIRPRTGGLTPNLLCRAALMLSLEQGPLNTDASPPEDGNELNYYTLLGDYGILFASLIRSVEQDKKKTVIDNATMVRLMRGHIQRGVGILSARVKTPADLLKLAAA